MTGTSHIGVRGWPEVVIRGPEIGEYGGKNSDKVRDFEPH